VQYKNLRDTCCLFLKLFQQAGWIFRRPIKTDRPRAAANAGMNIHNKNRFTNIFIMEEIDASFM
jgi:hypothetical protein